jgi:hypothetical protein
MVTGLFLCSLLVTSLYFFGLIPGERKTLPGFTRLLTITGVLLIATVASWIAAMSLSSDNT